jgi:sialate O-acetylesterase
MIFLSLFAATNLLAQRSPALPLLSPMFGSHMVLQRDRPNTFWGWTSPGTRVTVTVGGRRTSGVADGNGKWVARISPPPVGGPYTVNVDGPEHVQLDDVLVGDVWICSGQSNMEMGIGLVKNAQAEIASANYPGVRLFLVQHDIAFAPTQLPVGAWAVCSPQSVAANGWGGFSAAAYFFGRELHQKLKIPIGLVETCWGGTIAEAWTSKQGLKSFPEFQPAIAGVEALMNSSGLSQSEKIDKWMRANDPSSSSADKMPGFKGDTTSADPAPIYEQLGLDKFDGVVWFQREVILPDTIPAGTATLLLGTVDDMDTTWINGTKVGESFSYAQNRQYQVQPSALKPGRNVLTIRVLDTGGPGGLMTPDKLALRLGDGSEISLVGGWRYGVGANLSKSSPLPALALDNPNVPTLLYNGMIAPVAPLAMKGAIWYQGESNAGRAQQYQRLLPAMIGDWRRTWGQGDFPFLIVQLANFATRHPEPFDDPWAQLRDAQTYTADHVRNAGMAVAIDIGDGFDIHPKDKQNVGHRLALAAERVAYGEDIIASGPVLHSSERNLKTIRLKFDHAAGGLHSSEPKLAGFQISGIDHKFYWADARIEGDVVVVSSPNVPSPVAVRYAWDSNPEATLYNAAGLPAVPFKTDK